MSIFIWYCKTCKKFDISTEQEQLSKPEHCSYRGIDIGTCKGKMIKYVVTEVVLDE